MRSSYTAAAIGVCNGSEVCGMGRPMLAEVARGGGGDLMEVRGAWREANPDGSSGDWRAEQAQVQCSTRTRTLLGRCLPVSIAGRWRLDADIGQGGRRRPMPPRRGFSLHLLPTRQAPAFRPHFLPSTTLPLFRPRLKLYCSKQDSICLSTLSSTPSKHLLQPPALSTPPIFRHLSRI